MSGLVDDLVHQVSSIASKHGCGGEGGKKRRRRGGSERWGNVVLVEILIFDLRCFWDVFGWFL